MNKTVNIKPFKFVPYLKSVLWGGERIAIYKGIDTDQHAIGESWEVSGVPGHESVVVEGEDTGLTLPQLIDRYRGALVGEAVCEKYGNTFPLLVKLIDAKRDLSLQVHPNDELAMKRHGSRGKTEMWYIIDADEGASIYAGLSQSITPDEYERMVADNTVMDVVARHESHAGDLFFLPAGRIHAIGAGNLLAEIQETSDITYRIYDYGRLDANGQPRQLHTELAKDAIDYNVYGNYKSVYEHVSSGEARLIKCDYFDICKVVVTCACDIDASQCDSFRIIMCLEGAVEVVDNFSNVTEMHRGETILVPAATSSLHITGEATLLTATM